MATTARWQLPYPTGSDAPDVPAWMEDLAVALDDHAKDDQGALASRPTSSPSSPGKPGRYYFATDTGQLFRDNGTGWDEIPIGAGYSTGDLKYSLQTANHGLRSDGLYAWLLCDGSEIPAGYTALTSLLMQRLGPFGVGPNLRPRLPDFRGRVPVAPGVQAEVGILGASDRLDVADRKVRHYHGPGTLKVAAGGLHRHKLEGAGNVVRDETGSGVTWGYVSWEPPTALQYRTAPLTEYDGAHTHDLTGAVGDTDGPPDGPAFLVGGNWFIKT